MGGVSRARLADRVTSRTSSPGLTANIRSAHSGIVRQHDLEIVRRSVAMQNHGQNVLEHDLALAIIDELMELKQVFADLKRLANRP